MTKKAIIERCKSILDKTPVGGFVKDIEDFNFLLGSFALCPYFDMKAQGQKIKAIQKKEIRIVWNMLFLSDQGGWVKHRHIIYKDVSCRSEYGRCTECSQNGNRPYNI